MIEPKQFVDYAIKLAEVISTGVSYIKSDRIFIKYSNGKADIPIENYSEDVTVASKNSCFCIEMFSLDREDDPHSANKSGATYFIENDQIKVHIMNNEYLIDTKEDLFNIELLDSSLVVPFGALYELKEVIKTKPLNICIYYVPGEEKLINETI